MSLTPRAVAVASSEQRLDRAVAQGAEATINTATLGSADPSTPVDGVALKNALREATVGGVDVAVDPVGGPATEAALRALDAFGQHHHPPVDFVMKLRGFEVLDEQAPVPVAGAREGSTFLLTYRHRRPVR